MQFACTFLGGSTTSTGLLATISITPLGTGCSPIHIFTLGGADGGDDSSGTYTVDAADSTTQLNAYGGDIGVNELGASCSLGGTPTPTDTNTSTPTVSPTPSATPSPTATPIPGAPDVTVSALSVPTSVDGGSLVSYSASVSNIGDAAAIGVTLDFALPVGDVPFKNGYCKTYSLGHFSCTLPNLAANNHAPGGPDELMVVLTTQAPIQTNSNPAHVTIVVAATNEPGGNTANNTTIVTTNVRGCPDLNGDNVINILDFSVASTTFGLHLGDPGYIAAADLNGDNVITISDLTLMAQRYGASCHGVDSDHDGLTDADEMNIYGTNKMNPDSDADTLPDGIEVLTYGSNPLVMDTSGDFYTDSEKVALGTDPTNYCLTMAADVNMDHTVNILDFSLAALSYHTTMGGPGFNPRADINRDGAINILDFSLMALRYGQSVLTCP